jgi:hypothetical protein
MVTHLQTSPLFREITEAAMVDGEMIIGGSSLSSFSDLAAGAEAVLEAETLEVAMEAAIVVQPH